MSVAWKFPCLEDVMVLLETNMHMSVRREGFHTRAGLCSRIAHAVGGRKLKPIEIADAVRTAFHEHSHGFDPQLLKNKARLLPRIIASCIHDPITAKEVQLLIDPNHR